VEDGPPAECQLAKALRSSATPAPSRLATPPLDARILRIIHWLEAMAIFTDLPTELRQGTLEYVLYSSVVPAERPNVDETNPLEWCRCEPVLQSLAPAYRHREQHAMSQLIPYMLVSKAFYEDLQYIWTNCELPELSPVLSISLVGNDCDRPIKGALLKWLTPRSAITTVEKIEWRVNFHDQKRGAAGRSELYRSYADAGGYRDFTLTTVLEGAIASDWFGIQPCFAQNTNNWGHWIFKLSTEVDEDVHLATSEYFTTEDHHLLIIPHPFREAQKLRTFMEGYVEIDLVKGCEIWVDSTLVYRLTARPKDDYVGPDRSGSFILVPYSGTNEVICEEFGYVMEIDPLLVPQPRPSVPYHGVD
jgi:hypothetical protein